MINSTLGIAAVESQDLLARTKELARRSVDVEADLLVHLAEIDDRKLYLDRAFSSMFAFCVGELGFSEDAAYNRIGVARAGRRLPAIIEAVRSGTVHLAGLRILVPHLTEENQRDVLAQAAGKSKREIEEIAARLTPQPPAPSVIRKLPNRTDARDAAPHVIAPIPQQPTATEAASDTATTSDCSTAAAVAAAPFVFALRPPEPRHSVQPLSGETFKVQFTLTRAQRDRLLEAQDLLRHSVPDGDLGAIVMRGLDLLVEHVKKERFAIGRKPRQDAGSPATRDEPNNTNVADGCSTPENAQSRHVPDPVKRIVYVRDGGRCSFVDERGHRCNERSNLEYDHIDGFARTGRHDPDGIRLLCRAHNQHAADKMYGRAFMDDARAPRAGTRPGATPSKSCESAPLAPSGRAGAPHQPRLF